MQLTITYDDGNQVFPADVAPDLTLADLKAYIAAESNLDMEKQIVVANGKPLQGDGQTLQELGLNDSDIVACADKETLMGGNNNSSNSDQANANANSRDAQIEQTRLQLLNNPQLQTSVQEQSPQLLQHLNDSAKFREETIKVMENHEAVARNLESALEHNPEVFGNINMLYVDVLVDGEPVKAFVDSGAQATIMNLETVERCKLTHLIDKRFQGVAKGVGEAKIVGRIHSAPMKVGDSFLPCSFTVMDQKNMDMLLGLDMLKRHQGVIDLKNNKLRMGDSEVPFLGEADIPKSFTNPLQSENPVNMPSNAAQSSSSSSARTSAQSSTVDETTLSNLMSMGFSRDQVQKALSQTGGNAEYAAALLFEQM